MKTSVVFVIAGLALLSVVCYASELKEQSSINEVLSTIFHFEQPEERGCLEFWWKCNPNDDKCCRPKLKCSKLFKLCNISIGK
uniref:Toxin-like peptide n=1 Tax=Grammostola rosea TaxID=432528 RepID=H7CEK5_GRARO|nr:toxin-like peptide [Grammostola rosea]